ncbi:MAG: InlB B-repeat-containing protein [Firmicutes bacterium]|nr:InlB B-repeat-containing protein [Bacillota bacterium]
MKNKAFKTKLLTVLLTLCMLLSLVPMTAATAFAANTTTVTNETELTAALNNADCTEIKLGSNIETTGKLYVERTVTLDLNGHTLSCSSENTGIIWVRKNGNLAIKDSGTGGKIDGQEKNCGIFIKGGVLTLESGSIVNCYEKIIDEYSGDGAAVDLETNGQFIMNGGAIEDCRAGDDGGAIDIGSGCTFIMNGGAIKNCKATKNGGAVIVKDKAKFEMNDGLIEGCSVTTTDGTGGGVYIANVGRFVMSGGTIKDCTRYFSDYYGYIGNGVAGETFSKAEIVLKGGTFDNCGTFGCTIDTHTVTFDSDGGSDVDQQEICNTSAIKPSDPKKDGYDFAGWYLGDTQYTFDTKITTDITLKAHWTPTSASTAITAATIQDVNFNYQPGDAPRATAAVAAADQGKYRIYDECWQELNENDEPVAIWHSNDGIYSTLPTITAFESGKKYVYSVLLLPERGYDFGREVAATVNGSTVTAVPGTDGYLSLPNVKTMIPTESDNPAAIDLIEINDVTVSFKDGDKPVFTGSVSENAAYAFRCEWWSLDSNTGILSTEPEWGGDIYKNKITAFEAGKTYHYGVYVTAYTADISPDAKLKINGQEVNYTRIGDDGDTQSFWVETELTMIPTADSHTHSYGTAWKYDDTNHWHECQCGDKADTAAHSFRWVIDKEATATEKGSKHEECTVCGYKRSENTVIDKLPGSGSTGNTGSGDNSTHKPGKNDSGNSPQTGDSSLIGWLAALLVSGSAAAWITLTGKKAKKRS